MKKWTTLTTASFTTQSDVSLRRAVEFRPLNEVECSAVLSLATKTLHNGKAQKIIFCPENMLLTPSGTIIVDTKTSFCIDDKFRYPKICTEKTQMTQRERELIGIYSLGKTLMECSKNAILSSKLEDLLSRMINGEEEITLKDLSNEINAHLSGLGATPASRFISQLCKTSNRVAISTSALPPLPPRRPVPPPPPVHNHNHDDDDEIEFSRLDCSTSSETSEMSPLPLPPSAMPKPSSPFGNSLPDLTDDKQHHQQQQRHQAVVNSTNLQRQKSYSTDSALSPKITKTFKPRLMTPYRNPSRLYRLVQPLTAPSTSPIPATKRCVGPEFIVMKNKESIVLDCTSHHARRDDITKLVDVVMLSGQRLEIYCSPSTITAGEVLENVLREMDLKESSLFCLATIMENEYLPLSSDTKLSKVAPIGWKAGQPDARLTVDRLGGQQQQQQQPRRSARWRSSSDCFTLYQRFRFLPENMDSFKDGNNKHQFYLQCRRDFIDARLLYNIPVNQALSLAAMELQVEFGDYSEDIHDEDYFILEHYLPQYVIQKFGREECYHALVQLHKAYLGQSQSKTEIRFCKEIQKTSNFGFHLFHVNTEKKNCSSHQNNRTLLGIHLQGLFLLEKSLDPCEPHRVVTSFFWHRINRIQYDKSRFQLSVKNEEKNHYKIKFYVLEVKARLMFDLAALHHKRYNQIRISKKITEKIPVVEYRDPKETGIRSLRNKFLSSKRQLSQRKLYTKTNNTPLNNGSSSLRRCTTTLSGGPDSKYVVKRLTHYASMADAANALDDNNDLDVSNKENQTPDQNYRYKVYLEPDEDDDDGGGGGGVMTAAATGVMQSAQQHLSLQEKSVREVIMMETPLLNRASVSRRRISTQPHRRRSESLVRTATTNASAFSRRAGRRSQGAGSSTTTVVDSAAGANMGMRMGTRISLSALHRERIRLTTDLSSLPPAPKRRNLDLDFETMEVKTLPRRPSVSTQQQKAFVLKTLQQKSSSLAPNYDNESLSDSLIDRFENMESEESEPERQIVLVILAKDGQGRLGLKITGTPSGIYIEDFDRENVIMVEGDLKPGARIVAINGRCLENVTYANALDLIRKSSNNVHFLVSQIKS